MIKVNEIIAWSAAEQSEYIELGIDQLNASVRSLRRSVDFYTRVFGFCTHDFDRERGSVVMKATARVDLVLHEQRGGGELRRPLRRWGFVVGNLDRARQAVWELGVRVARDSGEADHIYRWSNRRSLYVHDPDANEIELVEVWSYARYALEPLQLAGAQ